MLVGSGGTYKGSTVNVAVVQLACVQREVSLKIDPDIAQSLHQWTSHHQLWAKLVLHAKQVLRHY